MSTRRQFLAGVAAAAAVASLPIPAVKAAHKVLFYAGSPRSILLASTINKWAVAEGVPLQVFGARTHMDATILVRGAGFEFDRCEFTSDEGCTHFDGDVPLTIKNSSFHATTLMVSQRVCDASINIAGNTFTSDRLS